jgi:hypothetical protein
MEDKERRFGGVRQETMVLKMIYIYILHVDVRGKRRKMSVRGDEEK